MAAASIPTLFAHDARIPVMGLGTGGAMDASCGEVVAAAIKLGYRHIDTARKYGTEEGVGEGIRASGVPREQIFITTKVSHEHLHAADFERSTETSLKALGVDHVDLLMVHWPLPDMPFAETMGALGKMKRRGLTRHVGVANFNIAMLDDAIRRCPEPIVALQTEYHPYLGRLKMHAACVERGVALVAYCPLGRGRPMREPALSDIAHVHGKTPAQVALRWLIQQDDVAVVPGSTKPDHLADNLAVFDFALTDDEMSRIAALKRPDGRLVNPKGRAPRWDD